jgi:hypothetical protein
MHPNPLCNLEVKSNIPLNFLKFAPCVVCLCGFPHNDVVVFVCRDMYHPWCALIHFKQKSKCIDPHCKTNMSLKWFKSFGFREFDKDLLEREISKGYEEYWLQQLNLWRQTTFVNCQNVISMLNLYSFCCFISWKWFVYCRRFEMFISMQTKFGFHFLFHKCICFLYIEHIGLPLA